MTDLLNNKENQNLEPVRIVTLHDDSGAHLSVEVVVEIEQGDDTYVLLTPSEPIVMILREDTTNDDAPLESLDPGDFKSIAKNIQDALIQHNVRVEVKSDEFVLVGEPNESFYADCDVMELEEEDGPGEYLVLVEVDDGNDKYLVVMSIEPALYPGVLTSEQEARLLTDQELEKVESLFSEVLSEWAEADEEEES
jgi:hypothetical protein